MQRVRVRVRARARSAHIAGPVFGVHRALPVLLLIDGGTGWQASPLVADIALHMGYLSMGCISRGGDGAGR